MQRPKLMKMETTADNVVLPIFFQTGVEGPRRRTLSNNCCIHIIPITVLLSFFILWWFCYPVNLEVKDGRVTEVPKVEKPVSLNETRVDLAFLAVAATSPYASVSHIPMVENQTAAEPPKGN